MKSAKFWSGAAYFLLALPLFAYSHTLVLNATLSLIAACSVFEALRAIGGEEARTLTPLSVTLALLLPFAVFLPARSVPALAFAYVLLGLLIYLAGYDSMQMQRVLTCCFITLLLGLGISAAAWSRRLPGGLSILVLTFAGTWCSDTMAQVCGRLFGKHKLGISVSPNKTVEGCVGSLLCTAALYVIAGVALNRLFEKNCSLPVMAVLGLLVSLAGQVGDLLASAIKRSCGVKDFGRLIPGHGGMYDRFDAFALVAPLVYLAASMAQILG